jgi:basic membrane protein A
MGWSFRINLGRRELEAKYQNTVTTEFMEIKEEGKADDFNDVANGKGLLYDAIIERCKRGVQLFYLGSFGFGPQGVAASRSAFCNDAHFVHISGYVTNDRLSVAFGRIYQMRYLTGVLAGLTLKENTIGRESNCIAYPAAFRIPEVVQGINAFVRGCRSVKPDCEVHVMWINTWHNNDIESQSALYFKRYSTCDIITQHTDSFSPQKVYGSKEFGSPYELYSISYNNDGVQIVGDSTLVSAQFSWMEVFEPFLLQVITNTWIPRYNYLPGYIEGAVKLSDMSREVKYESRVKLALEEEKLASGVDSSFCGDLKTRNGQPWPSQDFDNRGCLTDAAIASMSTLMEGVTVKGHTFDSVFGTINAEGEFTRNCQNWQPQISRSMNEISDSLESALLRVEIALDFTDSDCTQKGKFVRFALTPSSDEGNGTSRVAPIVFDRNVMELDETVCTVAAQAGYVLRCFEIVFNDLKLDTGYKGQLNLCDRLIANYDGDSKSSCSDDLYWETHILAYVTPTAEQTASVQSFAILSLVITIASLGLFAAYRKGSSILRLSQPMMMIMIGSGCVLGIAGILTNWEIVAANSCNMGALWMINSAYDLVYGPIVLKTWRMYEILLNPEHNMKKVEISDSVIFFRVFLLVIFDTAVFLLWFFLEPVKGGFSFMEINKGINANIVQYSCTYFSYTGMILILSKFIMVLVACKFALETRFLDKHFCESKHIVFILYNQIVTLLITAIVFATVVHFPALLSLVSCFGIWSFLFVIIVYAIRFGTMIYSEGLNPTINLAEIMKKAQKKVLEKKKVDETSTDNDFLHPSPSSQNKQNPLSSQQIKGGVEMGKVNKDLSKV